MGAIVDNSVKNQKGTPAIISDVLANQPAANFSGRLFVSTDTFALYRDTGSAWDLIGGPGTGTITGSGTAGKLVKFTGAAVISDSIMTESGAAVSVAGTITATSLIKSGGTSSQFLMADGSINTNVTPTGETLATVTGRGATTSTAVTLGGNDNIIANSHIGRSGTDYPAFAYNVAFQNTSGLWAYSTANDFASFIRLQAGGFQFWTAPSGAALSVMTATNVGSISQAGLITGLTWNGVAIANNYLANSTISGVALGGTLAALTANNGSLTFSGSYTGAAAITVELNLNNANAWTARQTVTINTLTNAGYFANGNIGGFGGGFEGGSGSNYSFIARNHLGVDLFAVLGNGITYAYSRLNINGATDNANFQLNVSGCTYTNSFSPTASTKTANWTIGDNTTYIFQGGAGVTATFETPATTNKLVIVKNNSASALTIASFNGTTNGIVNLSNAVVASISLASGAVAIFQQSGGTHTFQIM